jgi:predicted nucleic acid-binding Zn ribbon protein
MDAADVTANNDFSEERLMHALSSAKASPKHQRGICLFCDTVIADNQIFCDADCREGYERVQRVINRTRLK